MRAKPSRNKPAKPLHRTDDDAPPERELPRRPIVKAVSVPHWGEMRHLVVPHDMPEPQCFSGARTLASGVVCQTVDPEWAKRIAELINQFGGLK